MPKSQELQEFVMTISNTRSIILMSLLTTTLWPVLNEGGWYGSLTYHGCGFTCGKLQHPSWNRVNLVNPALPLVLWAVVFSYHQFCVSLYHSALVLDSPGGQVQEIST